VDVTRPEPEAAAVEVEAAPARVEAGVEAARAEVDAPRRRLGLTGAGWVTLFCVALATFFVLWMVNPDGVLFRRTTPTGGDLGAHVWGPAYLRDEVLPRFRLSGWTPDWYAGFPAYHFYMVVPMLLVVVVDVGLLVPLALPVSMLSVAGLVRVLRRRPRGWVPLAWGLGCLSVLVWPVHYGMAIKLVSVAGLVALPVAGWALGRLSGLPFPGPALLSVSTLLFVFDRSFNIMGGNLMSTMAGEFAFALAVPTCLVYIGLMVRGVETGRDRAWAALLLALTGLFHLLVAFFALVATGVAVLLRPGRATLRWVVGMGALAGLLSAFWVLPFWWRSDHLNDMAWHKLTRFRAYLWDRDGLAADFLTNDPPLQPVLIAALVGAVLSVLFRRRLGLVLAGSGVLLLLAFIHLPEGRLYNGRILPAYYLCAYLLAGLAVAEVLRLLGRLVDGLVGLGGRTVAGVGTVVATLAALVVLGLPLRALPGGSMDGNAYRWLAWETEDLNLGRSWARWNFSGYEERTGDASGGGWDELRAFTATMEAVAGEHGCGRLMWEYKRDLTRYGTPMALMLVPMWTDGCVGSMEGLYFESSTTTPFHFLVQSELSPAPSRAQRHLPYRGFTLEQGLEHLRQLGVPYYAAFSEQPVNEARAHPAFTEVANSGPWTVFLVDGAPLVEGLEFEPAVWADVDHGTWLDPAVEVFQQGDGVVQRSIGGPDAWQRVAADEEPEQRLLDPVVVSGIEAGVDRVSFDVDRTGVPVVVKVSYFPNWSVEGADGPWRLTPNLMVVVPTDGSVTLTYGRTGIDVLASLLTIIGLVVLVVLWRRREPTWPMTAWYDVLGTVPDVDGAVDRWADRRSIGTDDDDPDCAELADSADVPDPADLADSDGDPEGPGA
jgi:hypothetical protein